MVTWPSGSFNPRMNIEKKTRVFEYAGSVARTPKAYWYGVRTITNVCAAFKVLRGPRVFIWRLIGHLARCILEVPSLIKISRVYEISYFHEWHWAKWRTTALSQVISSTDHGSSIYIYYSSVCLSFGPPTLQLEPLDLFLSRLSWLTAYPSFIGSLPSDEVASSVFYPSKDWGWLYRVNLSSTP